MITVQLGQCGQQLGCSFFQGMASEFGAQDYGRPALEQWFRPVSDHAATQWSPSSGSPGHGGIISHTARAVLIDMEPKVVNAVKHAARVTGKWWSYPPKSSLCMDSGAGNNWANGYHGYGPSVREPALDLIRREVEACDVLEGFLLLQSMAGGTGAGLGTYVATALRDEYPATHALNCCVWPYESGEVIVQSYNTLLTLSHLHCVSDGIITLENDALHRCCTRLMQIPRPSFADMNAVAAQSLTAALLPSTVRPPKHPTAPTSPNGVHTPSHRGSAQSQSVRARKGFERSPASAVRDGRDDATAQRPVRLLSDVVTHLCCHPMYRMLSLRSLPQVPSGSIDFTTFTWPAITKRLRQMLITGSSLEEGLDWGVSTSPSHASPSLQPTTSPRLHHSPGAGLAGTASAGKGSLASSSHSQPALMHGRHINKSLASWLVLRGQGAGTVDVGDLFADPALYPWWAVNPLLVSSHASPFAKCTMSAAMLSNDQSCVAPIEHMQERAYSMLSSRAYVHQYEKYGMTAHDFHECFAQVEEIAERYRLLQ
uniref:Tubulin delta chain n=1 Tax=Dunaliella tertiolecta TaxID=3047 RepID=A0A7S3QX23_DUNTE|mmetsp:Transcript_20333/g.56665  ORF Transcript_20333/g.56665 Transcript_20333/m.56665 type:complete len:541 (+) Transcript_20333:60-1682(+)